MTRARALLCLAAVLFVGWLGWLGYAVYAARWAPGTAPVVSRAQLAAATHLLVGEVTIGQDGVPQSDVKVVEVLRGEGANPGQVVTVRNLRNARPPGAKQFDSGPYLLAVVGEGSNYSVAGLPRSPGYEATAPAVLVIYPWSDDVRAELRTLGVVK